MFMCAHVYDVALCGNTIGNVAIGNWLAIPDIKDQNTIFCIAWKMTT